MIAEIINALTQELKYFVKNDNALVILDTNLDNDITFSFPLIIISKNGTPESARLPGNGVTRMDWSLSFSVYTSEPDAYIDDESTGSTAHLNYSDSVRNHLESENWITQLMVNLTTNYDFRITYVGSQEAKTLETEDKTYLGDQHNFETISFDKTIIPNTEVVESAQTVVGEVDFV